MSSSRIPITKENIIYYKLRKTDEKAFKYVYNEIKKALETNKPLMIGKIGATELEIVYNTMLINNRIITYYPEKLIYDATNGSGIYPPSPVGMKNFSNEYIKILKNIDILSSWNDEVLDIERHIWEDFILGQPYNPANPHPLSKNIVDLTAFETFYTSSKYWWQNLFENKTILIISPFTASFEKQLEYPQRDKVWTGKWNNFWSSNIKFKFIKYPQPFPILSESEKVQFPKTYNELMEKYKKEIDKIGEFDIALIGIGGHSLMLASYIKTVKKKIAIHMGGGLQMMFGVYGNRWLFNDNPLFKEYINEHWIRPTGDEIPPGYKKQEFGAYFQAFTL